MNRECRMLSPLVLVAVVVIVVVAATTTMLAAGAVSVPVEDGEGQGGVFEGLCEPETLERMRAKLPLDFARLERKWAGSKPHWRADSPIQPEDVPGFLTPEMLRKSRANVGNVARLAAVMAKAVRGETVRVAVFGGSVTGGVGCSLNGRAESVCTWSGRLVNYLRELHPQARFELLNIGHVGGRGMTSVAAADMAREKVWRTRFAGQGHDPDLVFLSYFTNDKSVFAQRSHESGAQEVMQAQEQFLRIVLQLPTHPAVIEFEEVPGKPPTSFEDQWWTEDAHSPVTAYYDIPMISFREAAWPQHYQEYKQNLALPHHFGQHGQHVPWWCHMQWSIVLLHALYVEDWGWVCVHQDSLEREWAMTMEQPVPDDPLIHRQAHRPTCASYDTYLDAQLLGDGAGSDGAPFASERVSGAWHYGSDVPEKYGWIASAPGAEITFRCTAPRGIVRLGYMSSYTDEWGVVQTVVSRTREPPSESSSDSSSRTNWPPIEGLEAADWDASDARDQRAKDGSRVSSILHGRHPVLDANTDRVSVIDNRDFVLGAVSANKGGDRSTDAFVHLRLATGTKFKFTELECC